MPQARANPLPFAQDFGKAGPTAPFCRKGLKCRRPGLVCPGSWQCSAVDPSLPKTRALGIMFMPQARANPLPFAQDFGKAGPTAPFCRKGLKCRRPGLVCPGSWQCSAVDPSLPKTQTLGIMFLLQARANMPFARDFGKAGPTALFCRKHLQCRRHGRD